MISKVVPSRGGRSPDQTLRYVADGRPGADGIGEKVESLTTVNCLAEEWSGALAEMKAVQAFNTRARHKTYHFILSCQEHESLTSGQWREAAQIAVDALGLQDHQRVEAVHSNTRNQHLHVVVNLIHPETFKSVQPVRDYKRLREACAEIERLHGLSPVGIGRSPYGSAAGNVGNAKASEMEAHAGVAAFSRWLRDNAAEPLLRAARSEGATWGSVQQVAAAHGAQFRAHGAGLVLSHTRRKLFVKASEVDRGLARGKMEELLGKFDENARGDAEGIVYAGGSRVKGHAARLLFERFQKQKDAARDARRAKLDDLRTRFREAMAVAAKENTAWRAQHRRSVRAKDDVAQAWDRAYRLRISAIRKQWKVERLRVAAEHPVLAWRAWLGAEADRGDQEAQAVLDKLKNRKPRARDRDGGHGR